MSWINHEQSQHFGKILVLNKNHSDPKNSCCDENSRKPYECTTYITWLSHIGLHSVQRLWMQSKQQKLNNNELKAVQKKIMLLTLKTISIRSGQIIICYQVRTHGLKFNRKKPIVINDSETPTVRRDSFMNPKIEFTTINSCVRKMVDLLFESYSNHLTDFITKRITATKHIINWFECTVKERTTRMLRKLT